ncbi:serine protease SPPA, chloroplastic [Trifolium repens]|nr:serine protease SPPA, chloroplastic [Trifolium repens]
MVPIMVKGFESNRNYRARRLRPSCAFNADEVMTSLKERLQAKSLPIASISDVAVSAGYYIAMGAETIVAENLSLLGLIGVGSENFNLGNLYEIYWYERTCMKGFVS